MKELVDGFVELERQMSEKKGHFALFALLLRDESPDRWDLVVSAPWIQSNSAEALQYIVGQMHAKFKPKDLLQISRVVTVDESDAAVQAINRAITVQHGSVELANTSLFAMLIRHAFVITSGMPVHQASTGSGETRIRSK